MAPKPRGRPETALVEPYAERAVLAAVLVDPARAGILDELQPQCFAEVPHRAIYDAMQRIKKRGDPVDQVTLTAELRALGRYDDVGGAFFIASLSEDLPSLGALDSYLDILRERRLRREAKDRLETAVSQLSKGADPSFEQIRALRSDLLELELESSDAGFADWKTLIVETIDDLFRPEAREHNVVPTGFYDLDTWLYGGFMRGQMVTLAGTTGRGKTAFAVNVAANMAIQRNRKVAYLNWEMSNHELALRAFSANSGMPFKPLRLGQVSENAKKQARDFARDISDAPLYLADGLAATPQHVAAKCRRLKDTVGLDIVIADYIQLMHTDGKIENRTQELSLVSRSLKQLAVELDVPVLVLSQLSRQHQKDNKRPDLMDLRDSGAIEQDSDIVLMLYAEKPDDVLTECLIRKHRNGSTGMVKLRFDRPCVRFQNHSEER